MEEISRGVCCNYGHDGNGWFHDQNHDDKNPNRQRKEKVGADGFCGPKNYANPFWVWTGSFRTYQELNVTRGAAWPNDVDASVDCVTGQVVQNGQNVALQEKFHRGISKDCQKHFRCPLKQRYEISPAKGK